MTRSAEIRRARRANSMLANPIAFMHEMTRRENMLARKINVAPVTVARLPLILMLVTTEAGRHGWSKGYGLGLAYAGVTLHTVAVHGRHVRAMIEAQMFVRELSVLSRVALAMTDRAIALIMRFFVAFATLVG
jgi:hypothetical protein